MPRTRLALAALLVLAALLAPLPAAIAQEGPRADGLNQPLLAANLCGSDTPGETQFTIAATGDLFPHDNIQAFAEVEGYDALFDHVHPFIKAADIGCTNFDGAMLPLRVAFHSPTRSARPTAKQRATRRRMKDEVEPVPFVLNLQPSAAAAQL